jgi:endonuclease YncB( thermonuclease family)
VSRFQKSQDRLSAGAFALIGLLAMAILLILLLAGCAAKKPAAAPPPAPEISAPQPEQRLVRVARVIDGDTFVTDAGERVRIAQIDAPELHTEDGRIAKLYLAAWVEGEIVRLTIHRPARDRYGRTLAKVEMRQSGSWLDVGEVLIKLKLARRWEES